MHTDNMRDITNKDNVIEFLGKAQSKIGELGEYISLRKHDTSSLLLCKELIDVVEAMTSCYNVWDDIAIQKIIDYYNLKADLVNIPYLKIVGYEIKFNKIVTGNGEKTTSVTELTDYISSTIALIQLHKHNDLKEIQGGKIGEYYHVDKKMYDKLYELTYPFITPTVSLSLSPNITLVEKGKSLSNIILNGTYVLNSGVRAIASRYYRGNILLNEYIDALVNSNHVDNSVVLDTTTYKYEVDFEKGGTKTATKVIDFVLPYYHRVTSSGASVTSIKSGVKILSKKPTSIDIVYTIPANNATTRLVKPYIMYDKTWGLPKNVYVDNNPLFDTVGNWNSMKKEVQVTLDDGSSATYYLLEYDTYTEGTFTFNFKL
jgi:hypothetical protein